MKAVAVVAFLFGCQADPVSVSSSNNPQVPVALLFEHDGCKIYRFYDHHAHYFTRCARATTVTDSHIKTGKHSSRDESIETETE